VKNSLHRLFKKPQSLCP